MNIMMQALAFTCRLQQLIDYSSHGFDFHSFSSLSLVALTSSLSFSFSITIKPGA